jgi:serine/threonine protein kinase
VCGRGKFSTVYRAVEKEMLNEVAIKVIDKDTLDDHEKEFLGTELAIIKVIQHPHVVELRDVYEDV